MSNFQNKIRKIITLMGFSDDQISVKINEEHRKVSLVIDDKSIRGDKTPKVMSAFNLLINQMLKKEGKQHHVIDLNYYRKERERLIIELARAAAKKATIKKKDVELPPMNSYERRIVHKEISTHPELETESVGKHKNRRVVIKRLK